MHLCYSETMKIEDLKTLAPKSLYFQVSEEVWYQTGADDADRDWESLLVCETLTEAVVEVLKYRGSNRLYIDLMQTNGNGSAMGSPVFAGWRSQMMDGSGWRYSNFHEMGMEKPVLNLEVARAV